MRTHHEIYEKISATLVEALKVDEDELHQRHAPCRFCQGLE
jgi:hypothetical protein